MSNLNFDPYTISVPLKQGASATTFASIWPSICLIRDAYDPDFVVLQCGVDGLAGDPHAIWNWSLTGPGSLGWCVNDVVNNWPGRKLLLGGGEPLPAMRNSDRGHDRIVRRLRFSQRRSGMEFSDKFGGTFIYDESNVVCSGNVLTIGRKRLVRRY